jgi:hypothetical protein
VHRYIHTETNISGWREEVEKLLQVQLINGEEKMVHNVVYPPLIQKEKKRKWQSLERRT